ncbi:hypothetical protein DAPPUDRAFT_300382 [Daphnia pulex]|uniref:Uncharacterized protein n=1 Tax=Daphnia pulex TaxID=6669 RepID=E9G4A9_DAPPU|nr:hypothetical protein DAPPUDRAFT_300382 [Daphnia pulex]|eukprot:EFX85585.1 hypothetical protein DAPPUDRAFT_300382 [Daphnia pulex]
MYLLNTVVILLVSVYVVNARPAESPVTLNTTTGQKNVNAYPNRPEQTAGYSNPIATGSYPAGSNNGPSYDNTIPVDELNFPGEDAHRALASMFNMNIPTSGGFVGNPSQKQMPGFAPTGYASGGISASASAVSISSQ